MAIYVYGANATVTEPLKNRTLPEIVRAYKNMFGNITVQVFKPTIHCLYNDDLTLQKKSNQENKVKYKLEPSGVHRQNVFETCIHMIKTTSLK